MSMLSAEIESSEEKVTTPKHGTLKSYCSHCFEFTEHILINKNYLRRNTYQCCACKQNTVICRYCSHMAKGGKWDDELCAEHDGDIASFERLKLKLSRLEDYEEIFKRDAVNMKKVGKVTALTIGGASVLGPLALAAAPTIGGAVGATIFRLTGGAAVNAGLAAIGGGSIVSGGLGMAGGTAVIGATGAALGGTVGGVVSNNYFGDVSGFDIVKIKEGTGSAIIFIDGFLSEKNANPSDWTSALDDIYPDNPQYYLKWESKRLVDLGKLFGAGVGTFTAKNAIIKLAQSATKAGAKKLIPAGSVMTAVSLVNNPWHIALVKAGQAGVLLSDIISRTDQRYILCGHSLGARVIYYALSALSTKSQYQIDRVHLLGGAVGNKASDWTQAKQSVDGDIVNYHSDNDWVLASLYKAGTFLASNPIGRNPIALGGVVNIDVTQLVSGHTNYKEEFPNFVRH